MLGSLSLGEVHIPLLYHGQGKKPPTIKVGLSVKVKNKLVVELKF